jgi:phosphatidylglycerol:prolipoprotein diacylglycerol transferase
MLATLLQQAVDAVRSAPAPHYYVHDLKPDLVRIPFWKIGPLQNGIPIRWYSLAYLLGLALAWWFMKRLAERRRIALDVNQVADLVIPFALLGVMIGGRLGYVLFYDVDPKDHHHLWLDHPMRIFQIWEGGMASHGGIVGVLVAMAWFAKTRRVPLLHVLDLCCLTAPIGLFLGRVANFVNGELWGRPTSVPWAVVFPPIEGTREVPPAPLDFQTAHPELQSWFAQRLCPRHPSQIYEALGEGLLLFLLLFALHRRLLPKSGALTAIFLFGYATARVVCEQFREPDQQIGFDWLGLTRGQVLTLAMFVAGAVVLWRVASGKTGRWSPPPAAPPSSPAPAATPGAAR